MKQLVSVKVAAAVIAGLGLTTGLVGVVGASSGSIGTTGDDSKNHVTATSATDKNADVNLSNENNQAALSGNATVVDNDDEAGDVGTGTAGNTGGQTVTGGVDFSGSGAGEAAADDSTPAAGAGNASGAITGQTGDDSTNTVETHSDYSANASVNINNTNNQAAVSGNTVVRGNENAGAATTGNASNASTQSTSFNVRY